MKTLNKQLVNLPIDILKLDSYQRPLIKSHVKKLVKKFNRISAGSILVSKREDGSYYIMDGQHRVEAMRKLGYQMIECVVYEGMTVAEEAKNFSDHNGGKGNHPLVDANALHIAGDDATVAIDIIVGRFGYEIDYKQTGRGIKAYKTLVKLYESKGEYPLIKTISIIHQAFGNVSAFNQFILQGVWDFIQEYVDRYDEKELVRKMKDATIDGLVQRAEMTANLTGCSKPKAMKSAILYFYDRNRRKKLADS